MPACRDGRMDPAGPVPCAAVQGTTLVVEDLFYNMLTRKKVPASACLPGEFAIHAFKVKGEGPLSIMCTQEQGRILLAHVVWFCWGKLHVAVMVTSPWPFSNPAFSCNPARSRHSPCQCWHERMLQTARDGPSSLMKRRWS